MLVSVQKFKQNTGNWKYDVLDDVEYINTDHIKRMSIVCNAVAIHLVGEEHSHAIIVDQKSMNRILERQSIK